MDTLTIDTRKYAGALQYAKEHHTSVQEMVEGYLQSFPASHSQVDAGLPPHLERLCGILKGVEKIEGDERLDYILEKHKYADSLS